MLPGSSKGGGMCTANAPDVCKIPGPPPAPFTPTPFPNLAQVSNASGTIAPVKFCNKDVVVQTSKISSSSGDEAGTLGGMVSAVNRNQVTYKTASGKVFAKGKKVCTITSMTAHNGMSANVPVGAQVAPSQTTVLVSP
jgi:hypothetical protein